MNDNTADRPAAAQEQQQRYAVKRRYQQLYISDLTDFCGFSVELWQ
jgi:hypothetical protein